MANSFVKLDPRKLTSNPVILAVWIIALLALGAGWVLTRGRSRRDAPSRLDPEVFGGRTTEGLGHYPGPQAVLHYP